MPVSYFLKSKLSKLSLHWLKPFSPPLFCRRYHTPIFKFKPVSMSSQKNKVAIVTGVSRNIGGHVSLKLAAAVARVCVNYFGNEAGGTYFV